MEFKLGRLSKTNEGKSSNACSPNSIEYNLGRSIVIITRYNTILFNTNGGW